MEPREPDAHAVPADSAEIRDDPFARALADDEPGEATSAERSATIVGPLAQRDPDAPADVSTEFDITGPISFDEVLRGARRRGFAAGAAAGALAAIVGALALSWAISRPVAPAPAPRQLAEEGRGLPPAPALPPRGDRAAVAPAASVREEAARPAGKRRAPSPGVAEPHRGIVAAPGLDLRSTERPGAVRELPGPAPSASSPAPAPAEPASGPPPTQAAEADPAPRGLDDGDVANALAVRRVAIERCLADHRADAGAGSRRFHLVVTIDGTGQVADARVDDPELGATPLGACLARVVRDLELPPFDGDPVRVELPLRIAGGE